MLHTTLSVVDKKTGEVVDKEFQEKSPKKPRNKDFVFVQQPMLNALLDLKLAASEYRVLLFLMTKCAWANKVSVPRKVIAERLGITTMNLWKTLRALRQKGVVHYEDTDRNTFYIDPWICWKGHPDERGPAHSRFMTTFPAGEGISL